ncbi:MFS transporter [Gallibacterium genomosp. 3]|uniref:Na+/xyloside symporter related transporter n=1 Tax=Gallibacterium genomosp. 3 TaxID=505345 RepID=A0A1A7QCW0_9PAST|nr:glycoside-pentoside-hexuronide (GPH):cation symporter [Gallibacterium genomosp. 3]OBX11762.1 Na+/xyloside symporter related transporter [Gallibacterium genomosp. 3]
MLNHQQTNNEFAQITLREKIAYGAGDLAQNLIFGTIGGFLLVYLITVNTLSAAAGATIFFIVKWINVFWDPWVGTVVDKAKITKNGKYRPYIIKFGIPLTIIASCLFLPIEATKGSFFYAFISYLATALIYSFVNIPYGSLNASLTRDNHEITEITTIRMTMANVANLLVYTLFPLFIQLVAPNQTLQNIGFFGIHLNLGNYMTADAGMAWFKVYAVYMLIGFTALIFCYFGTKERILPKESSVDKILYIDLVLELKNNYPLRILGLFFLISFTFMFFGNTVWPFYMNYNIGHQEWMGSIGLIGSLPGIFLVALWPYLRATLGKKRFFFLFLAIFIIGQLLLYVWQFGSFKDSPMLGYIGRFLQQWGLTSATGFMWALVPEVINYGEFKSQKRVAGIINALMGLFFKIGLALGGIIPAYINAFFGFDGSKLHQTAEAMSGINISMIWVPIILAIIAGYVIALYPLSDEEIEEMNVSITKNHHLGESYEN